MRQTLVQLTDELVKLLDDRAARLGQSRSKVIRDLLEQSLAARAQTDRALVEGYRTRPQADAWGDLDAFTAANGRRNMEALDAEDGGW